MSAADKSAVPAQSHTVPVDKPLLHARRPVGRPRKAETGHTAGTVTPGGLDRSGQDRRALASQASALLPRLLDLGGAATYLGVSVWTVRDMEAAGTLKRIRIPQANGKDMRKILFDRLDLDTLIDSWKE